MKYRPDISIFSADDRLQAVIEVKGLAHKGPEWAAEFRQNLLTRWELPSAAFFLLVLPDQMFLWKGESDGKERSPDLTLSTQQVLEHFLSGVNTGRSRVGDSALELSLVAVFEDLTKGNPATLRKSWAKQLVEAGLVDAIRNGSVKVEAPT